MNQKKSIYISNKAAVIIGDKTYPQTEEDNQKYINSIKNWRSIYNNLINKVIDYSNGKNLDTFKDNIYQELIKINIQSAKSMEYPPVLSDHVIIPKDTILYRYTDCPEHCYSNPTPQCYSRLTDPNRCSTFYLAFDQFVAKDEATSNNTLIKYKVKQNIKANLFPVRFPILDKKDMMFENRLRRLCNLVFSLTTNNKCFTQIKDKDKLEEGIYIVTNTLFDMFHHDPNEDVFIYPSTKVKENSKLGNILANSHFVPNKGNADIAILNDVHYDNNGNPYSKYVEVIGIIN